jgi:hypothetical protein
MRLLVAVLLPFAILGALRAELAAWRDRVDARMPVPNPNHDPARASHRAKPEHDVPYVP